MGWGSWVGFMDWVWVYPKPNYFEWIFIFENHVDPLTRPNPLFGSVWVCLIGFDGFSQLMHTPKHKCYENGTITIKVQIYYCKQCASSCHMFDLPKTTFSSPNKWPVSCNHECTRSQWSILDKPHWVNRHLCPQRWVCQQSTWGVTSMNMLYDA